MPENVVSVKLVSEFIDRTERALKRTERNVNQAFQSMRNAAGGMRQGVNSAGLAMGGVLAGGAVAAVLAIKGLAIGAFEVGKELAKQSSAAVELRGNLASLASTYKAVKDGLTGYGVELLVAIQRGGVFQELAAFISAELKGLKRSQEDLNAATIVWNQRIITVLEVMQGLAVGAEGVSVIIRRSWLAMGTVINGVLAGVATSAGELLSIFGDNVLADTLKSFAEESLQAYVKDFQALTGSLTEIGAVSGPLGALIEKLKGFTSEIRGADAPVKKTAKELKELNAQLAAAARLRDQLESRGAIGAEEKLAVELQQRIAEINALTLIDEQQRNELLTLARGNYNRAMEALNQKRLADEAKAAADLAALNQQILSKLTIAAAELPEDLRPQIDLTVEELNRINEEFDFSVLAEKFERFRTNVLGRFTQGTLQVWSDFWSDLVTGQENAGRKLLAGMLELIAKEAEAQAQRLALFAIVNAALGNFGQAAKQAAAAAALGVAAGVLRGAASNLAGATGGRTDGTFQDVEAPTSPGRTRTQSAGAAGGPQSAGEAYQQRRQPTEVVIRLEEGLVANHFARAVDGNDTRVRFAVQRAMA